MTTLEQIYAKADKVNPLLERIYATAEQPEAATLASRIEALLVQASGDSWKQIHDAARDHAATLYKHAVDRTINYAETKAKQELEAKKRMKNTQDAINVIFFSLIEEAEQEAYRAATSTLATAEPSLEGVQTHPEHEEVADFQQERRPLLEAFPADLHERLLNLVHDGIAEGLTDTEIRSKLALEASAWRAGRGATLAQTEAQSTYGAAQVRLLKKAGFKTVVWNTEEDEKVRPSHRKQDGVEREIGKPFPNGCRWPGDSVADAAEICNCRCWLTGGRRK